MDEEEQVESEDVYEKPENDVDIEQDEAVRKLIAEINESRIRMHDERSALNRTVRANARITTLLDLFKDSIKSLPPIELNPDIKKRTGQKAILAMLSDVHYGTQFDTFAGKYNPDIARKRILDYADQIIRYGETHNASQCYVSFMGDMISGNIHSTTKLQNKENVVDQIMHISELCSCFLYRLSEHFTAVHVNNVSGNHSRLEMNPNDAMPSEKLDKIVPWYCMSRLSDIKSIRFQPQSYNGTAAVFNIYGKNYVSVHGDMDKTLTEAKNRMQKVLPRIDCVMAGHLHVPEFRFEDIAYIRNGAVVSSGDSYTIKNRLFGKPCQVTMAISKDGIEDIHPVFFED